MKNDQQGFVALMAVLIMAVVLFTAVFSVAQFGITSRFTLLDLERKAKSATVAEACIHIARIDVVNDPNHEVSTPDPEAVSDEECFINSVDYDSGTERSTIQSYAEVDGARSNLQAVINADPDSTDFGKFISFVELDNF